jgi:hypothetical protein
MLKTIHFVKEVHNNKKMDTMSNILLVPRCTSLQPSKVMFNCACHSYLNMKYTMVDAKDLKAKYI